MSWIICFYLSAICVIIAAVLFVFPSKRKADYMFVAIVCAGFLSYLPHYLNTYGILNSVIADIVNLLQIITLNSNTYETLQGSIPVGSMFIPYIIIRGIVHVSTPVLFAYVAFAFLFSQLANIKRNIVCGGKKRIFIFSEYNDLASIMISDIQSNEPKSAFVFLRDEIITDKHIDNVEDYIGHVEIDEKRVVSLDKKHFLSFFGKIIRKKHADIHVICNDITFEKNINICLSLINYCKLNLNIEEIQRVHIDVFAKSNDSTSSIIDSLNGGMLSIRIVDRYQIAANELMMNHPLYDAIKSIDGRKYLSVAVIGNNELALDVLKSIVWCGQMPEVNLEIHFVVDKGRSELIERKLQMECPELLKADYNISIYESDIKLIDMYNDEVDFLNRVGYIVICGEDDDENHNLALRLQRQYYKLNNYESKCPLIMPEVTSSMRRNAIEQMTKELYELNHDFVRIYPFGDINSIYSYEELVDSKLFRLGKNVNYAYEEYFNEDKDCLSEKFIREKAQGFYNNENSKKSNMAAALHIQYKLWMLGYVFCEKDDVNRISMDELRKTLNSNEELLKKLCRAEHDRWVAYHRTEGWRTESIENIQKIYKNRLGNKNKSELLKTHIDICPYNEIESRREQCGLEDSTPLDRAIIKCIPDILEDKWTMDPNKKVIYIKNINR